MRVREEAAVEDEVDVEGQAVLVPERHTFTCIPSVARMLPEQLVQAIAQLVHVEVRRVDDEVGIALQWFEQRPFPRDAVD